MPQAEPELVAALDAVETFLHDDTLPAWPTRADDLALVRATRERLERRFTLAVVGEFSSGKSYLLNALLGKARYDPSGRITGLLATDINPSTATITELEYGDIEAAVATYPSGRRERVPLESLARFVAVGRGDGRGELHGVSSDTTSERGEDVAPDFVVVSVASPFLRDGFVVADTPGLASLNPAHRRATLGYLPRSDAVLYLIDTQQPFTEGDAAFLGLIGEHVRTIFIVQTKIDLWQMPESDGRAAWEAARTRIVERAARYAPGAEVYSVSARDFAAGTLGDDEDLRAQSGFPALIAGLERSLAARAQNVRNLRARTQLRTLVDKTSARIRRAEALLESDADTLAAERDRAGAELAERERALGRERDETVRAGAERRVWIVERGGALAGQATRALAAAIDVADIERIRDRGKFGSLVDATVAPIWTDYARDVAGHVARALDRIVKARPSLRVSDLAALRLGGEPGSGAWSRDLASGITSTIVLGAIGGPTVSFVHGIARTFAAHRTGAYMKRELGSDLQQTFFPAFEAEVAAFVESVAARIAGVYDDVAALIERERAVARAEALDPIERALAAVLAAGGGDAARATLLALDERLAAVGTMLAEAEHHAAATDDAAAAESNAVAAAAFPGVGRAEPAFDADAYDRGLRPERYRVVILGALRRGKSSLINALAGTRLLADEGAAETRFPMHVRYGAAERAYALEGEGSWHEIATRDAMAQAALTPVLIETPWPLPRQLVLVHAPAFDSGDESAEEIAVAAARAASEIVGLFSRQLSDRELALYARVAAFERPLLLAHTFADNETPSERRTVVELASRYVRERSIPVGRIFTVSVLDFQSAARERRAPAGWNELAALRDTLLAHAEEHMGRLEARRQVAVATGPAAFAAPSRSAAPSFRTAIARLLGKQSE